MFPFTYCCTLGLIDICHKIGSPPATFVVRGEILLSLICFYSSVAESVKIVEGQKALVVD